LKQYITGHTLANDARMRRIKFDGSFLFVEGDSDDRLYGIFLHRGECQIIICYTRGNVVDVCLILNEAKFDGVAGIIDSDFDKLDGKIPPVGSVFQTDLHDAECMMLNSPAFEKLVQQYASREKMAEWESTHGTDLRGYILVRAAPVGALLRHSNADKLNHECPVLRSRFKTG